MASKEATPGDRDMNRLDYRYLRLIHSLILYQHHLIADTNAHIERIEAQANDRLEELISRQIAADGQVLATWQDNARLLWEELKAKEAGPKAGKAKPKKWRVAE